MSRGTSSGTDTKGGGRKKGSSGKQPMKRGKAKEPCGATTRSGGACQKGAGWGTDHAGHGYCKLHGGSTPNGKKHGAREALRHEAIVMGAPIDIEPHEALMQCIRIAAGEVQYASERIAELDPAEAVGPSVSTRPLKEEKGAESPTSRVEEHGPPALHIWIQVRQKAMDRLANYARLAIAAGIAERQVEIAEKQAHLIVKAMNGLLKELGIDPASEEARRAVRNHLTLVADQSA